MEVNFYKNRLSFNIYYNPILCKSSKKSVKTEIFLDLFESCYSFCKVISKAHKKFKEIFYCRC